MKSKQTTSTSNGIGRTATVGALLCFFLTQSFAGEVITFPDTPLQASSGSAPNLMLPISVEFPTVGSAYNGSKRGLGQSLIREFRWNGTSYDQAAGQYVWNDPANVNDRRNVDSYFDPNREYVGYWRSDRCYDYATNGTGTADDYFVEAAVAVNFRCSGSGASGRWSGNFLNWSQTSSIDVLRRVMTGGYRHIDTPTLTVLERAQMLDSRLRTRGGNDSNNARKEIGRRQSLVRSEYPNLDPKLFTPFDRDVVRVLSNQDTFTVEAWTLDAATNRNTLALTGFETVTLFPRVRACESTLGPALADSCLLYQTGSKPVGEIQLKSRSIRFGASGYLMDDTLLREGGVIRAPIGYAGLEAPDNTGNVVANANAEWDQNGVFVTNPRGAVEGNSGVINYLNKFGRAAGRYKTFDNWGELYSESVRYLMGLQPKAESIALTGNAATDATLKDGFPIATTWTDPIQNSCQKNYIITIGDTNTHCDGRVPGFGELKTADCGSGSYPAETIVGVGGQPNLSVDARTWLDKIDTALKTRQTGSGSRGTYAMAGLAYLAASTNIRPDKDKSDVRVKTYVVDVDENSGINYWDRAGWLAAKYGGYDDIDGAGKTKNALDAGEWEKPSTITGAPGAVQPKTFFVANDGKALQDSLRAALADIAAAGTGNTRLASSSSRITSSASGIFQTETSSSTWTGDLLRRSISFSNVTNSLSSGAVTWRAAELLTGNSSATPAIPAKAPGSRVILTWNGSAGVNFAWSTIPTTLQDEFRKPYFGQTGTQTVTEGARRLDWVRGVRTGETGTNALRARVNLLGDSGNASPVYVGPPGSDGFDEKSYFDFARTNRTRTEAVYLGSSNGLLHAFNAATGDELFAYAPSALHQKLAQTPSDKYARKPMVDATPVVVDAKIAGGAWATVLVGGLGGGGRGLYALNVTNPSGMSPSSVLWEFSDPDLGHVTAPPYVARLADGKFVVVVGSGYNNGSGDGYVFIIRLDRGGLGSWVENSNFAKIRVTSNSSFPLAGLAQPTVSRDLRGNLNRIYVGDLDGNLHRILPPTAVSGAVSIASTAWSAKLLFQAKDSSSNAQPITAAPAVVFHPLGGLMVLFGTGKMLEQSDRNAVNQQNTFYGFWDNDETGPSYPMGRAKLAARSYTESSGRRLISTASEPIYSTGPTRQYGWYVDLNRPSSEAVVFPANVDVPEIVDFTTQLGLSTCEAGSGYYMSLNPITGLMTPPRIDLNGDGVLNSSDVFAGLATDSPPTQVSSVKLERPSDPYAPVSYVKFVGAKISGINDPSKLGASVQRVISRYGRLNYRQITEIKR